MQSNSRSNRGIPAVAACGIALFLSASVFQAKADTWDKKTVLTVNQPIQVQDTYLEAGTYVFKLLSSQSNRHIVQIFDKDQTHLINTVLAIPNYRLRPTGTSRFAFYETPQGTAPAMRAWFYPGDNFGQEFRYPKNPRQLAYMATSRGTMSVPDTRAELQSDQPASNVQQQAVAESSTKSEERVVASFEAPAPVNEAAAEPEAAAVTAAPEAEAAEQEPVPAPPAAQQEPARTQTANELPRTGSPYPLIGLAGVLSLVAFGLLRLKRVS